MSVKFWLAEEALWKNAETYCGYCSGKKSSKFRDAADRRAARGRAGMAEPRLTGTTIRMGHQSDPPELLSS